MRQQIKQMSGVLMGAAILMAAMAVPFKAASDSHQYKAATAADLLEEIQANVLDVREHAARLKSYTRYPESTSWKTHYFEVDQMKQRMNRIADLLGDFKAIRTEALSRQVQAFNQIVPEAAKIEDLVEQSIRFLDDNRASFAVPGFTQYQESMDDIYDRADLMSAAIDLAETRSEIERLMKETTETGS